MDLNAPDELVPTPEPLRGTPLQAPTRRAWRRANEALVIAGCVALASPVVHLLAGIVDAESFLAREAVAMLIIIAGCTAFWTRFALRRAESKIRSLVVTCMLAAALNAGSIAAGMVLVEGRGAAAIVVGAVAILVTAPVSLPIGFGFGALLDLMVRWERRLRDRPTHDATLRWRSVAATWLLAMGAVGEVVLGLGRHHPSDFLELSAWGVHGLLGMSAALGIAALVRLHRERRFVADVGAGRVPGLRIAALDGHAEPLVARPVDVSLVVDEGEGAFRSTGRSLGGLGRQSRTRALGLLALIVVALGIAWVGVRGEVPTPAYEERLPMIRL